MKKFLFITHLSPVAIRSSLRQGLIDTMIISLHQQTYKNWKALWIGEKEYEDAHIKEVKVTNPEELNSVYLRQDVLAYLNDCDYVVKLDDDDIIMPYTLQIASKQDFDCYCDLYHTFYDISSGTLTQQKRNWIASTCIHKREHSVKLQNNDKIADNFISSLFYGDHGLDWIRYYKDKKIVYANKNTPLYIRVLSPTSITAGAKTFPVKKFKDIEMMHYCTYLKQFGAWNKVKIKEFDFFREGLSEIWKLFSGKEQKAIEGISVFDKFKDKLRSFYKK